MGIKHSLVADSSKTITSSAWNADHIVDSTALITNLNADLLDGYHATDLGPTHSHSISQITINNNIVPQADNAYDLGSDSKRYRTIYLRNNLNFPIWKTGTSGSISQCSGIYWYGLTDSHRIFVEEYSGTGENSRLVIQNEDNGDADYLLIRNHSIGQGTKNVMEFRWSYIGAGTELRPLSDNSIDLGNSSYKWRNVYANTIIASTLSGTIDWSQINNKPSSFTPTSHTHLLSEITINTSKDWSGYSITNVNLNASNITSGILNKDRLNAIGQIDNRNTSPSVADYNKEIRHEFKVGQTIGLSSNAYLSLISIAQWGDDSGGGNHQLAFQGNTGIFYRYGTRSSGWGSWTQIFPHLYPSANGSYDLGDSSNRWRAIYANTLDLSSEVKLTKSSLPRLRVITQYGYTDIGPVNTSWSHFSTDRPRFYFDKPTNFDGDVEPYTDSTRNLGSTSKYWLNVYCKNFVNFPIRKTDQAGSVAVCGGLSWAGLSDQFRIMVEEYSGTIESTRLVLQSADNKDVDYISIRSVDWELGTKTIMDFRWSYISAGTELRPVSDNSIDLGNNSYKWRTVYANTIVANTLSGTIDWSQINNKPSVTGYITPYAGDETEITITSTSDTSIKNANVVRLSSVLGTFSTMIFVMEGKVTSGNTLYLSAYLSGNLVATKTFTTTSYSLDYCQANTGGFGDGVYSVELKARVSGGTGYNRIFEVYLR